ncbi:MAG: hypothetical protein ACUVQS_05040 [Candidatus Bipolaricaulaceae bacterium]
MIAVGVLGTATGTVAGSPFFTLLPYFLTRMAWLAWVTQGAAIILIMEVAPLGLVGAETALRSQMFLSGSAL